MPQIFQVLRCFKCAVFQIQPTKKSKKFQCKMCGEKQSIKRHYGIGTGKDCRLHVQRLNGLRGEMIDEMELNNSLHDTSDEDEVELSNNIKPTKPLHSKWSEYVEQPVEGSNEKEPMYLGDKEVVLEVPKKRAKRSEIGEDHKSNIGRTHLNKNTDNLDDTCIKNTDFKTVNINEFDTLSKNKKIQVKFVPPMAKIETENYTQACVKVKNKYLENIAAAKINVDKNKKTVKREHLQPKISSNSKWAQFVDDVGDNEIEENYKQSEEILNKDVPDDQLEPLLAYNENENDDEVEQILNNDEPDDQVEQMLDYKKIEIKDQLEQMLECYEPDDQLIQNNMCNHEKIENVDQFEQILDCDEPANQLEQIVDNEETEYITDPKALFSLCNDADIDNVLDI